MRCRVLVVMFSLILAVWATVGMVPQTAHASRTKPGKVASTCGGGAHRWHTWAHSGQGRLQGTGAEARTWKHWNVALHQDGFSDEAVWLINANNPTNALEVGFVTGQGENHFSNHMYSYYTTDDGLN